MTDPLDESAYAARLSDARWFTIGAIAMALLSLPTQVLFERGLGVDGFAQWLLVNALVSFFVPLAALGSANLVLSEFFEGHLNDPRGRRALARYFLSSTAVAAIGFFAVYAWAPLAGERTRLDVVLGLLIVLARTPVALVYPFFQIHRRARLVAFWPTIENLGRFLLALASVFVGMTFTQFLAWWLAFTATLALFAVLSPGILKLPPVAGRGPAAGVSSSVTTRGIRFGVAEYLDSLDLKLAIPVAGLFLSSKQIAAVGLGLLFLNAVHFLPFLIVTRYLLPAIHSREAGDRDDVHGVIVRWLVIGSAVIAAGALVFAAFGGRIVALLVEGDYSDQGYLFPIVGLAMIPLCFSILGSARFLRVEHTKHLLTWRLQATLGFLLVTALSAPSLGASAPILGILASRTYLVGRFVFAGDRHHSARRGEPSVPDLGVDQSAG